MAETVIQPSYLVNSTWPSPSER